MSNHFSATIPLTETPIVVEGVGYAAHYLIRHGAADLAEALGMTDYQGADIVGRNGKKPRPVLRKGSLR